MSIPLEEHRSESDWTDYIGTALKLLLVAIILAGFLFARAACQPAPAVDKPTYSIGTENDLKLSIDRFTGAVNEFSRNVEEGNELTREMLRAKSPTATVEPTSAP